MIFSCLWKSPLVIFLTVCTFCQAQSQIDSLQKVLDNSEGIDKVKTLNRLSEVFKQKDDLKQAILYAENAISLSKNIHYTPGIISGYENFGMASKNNYLVKIEYLLRAITLAEQTGNLETVGRIAINLGQSYLQPNNYEKSLEYYLKALSVNEKLGNKKLQARAQSGVGWVYKSTKQYTQALESYERSIATCKELGDVQTIAWSYVACASVYNEMKDYKKALLYGNLALDHFESRLDSGGMAISLYRMGEIYRKQKLWDDAASYLHQARLISEKKHLTSFEAVSNKLLGEVYQGKNQMDKALSYFLRSLTVAKDLEMREHVSEVCKSLASIYKQKGDFKNALAYHEMFNMFYDSVFNQEKNKQIAEMQARFEAENKQKEIEALKKDQQINKLYRITGAVSLVLLIIISVLIINHQRLKGKQNSEISKRERQILEKEVEKQKLSEEKLRTTLDHNNKSLTSYTLNLIHKNEMLDDIKMLVQQIRALPDEELRQSLNTLLKTVNYSIHLDKDWENFKSHFEQVHQGFFDKLKDQFPELSPYDLRLCSLVKLNLETKQIATLLDISTDSAKVARSRVRKKMGLQMEQNLQEFLQTF